MKPLCFHQIVIIKQSPDETLNGKSDVLLGATSPSDDAECFILLNIGNKETVTVSKKFLHGTGKIVNNAHDSY